MAHILKLVFVSTQHGRSVQYKARGKAYRNNVHSFCNENWVQPLDLACGTLLRSSYAIQTSPTDCSDDSWMETFLGNHKHGALWLLM